MTKCHIIRDLLPAYIDGLVSAETENTVNQHLQECEACHELHAKLSAPIENHPSQMDKKEIDFLKKVRKKMSRKIVVGFAVLLLVFAVLTYFLAIGSPVNSKDLIYTTMIVEQEWKVNSETVKGDVWQVDMELTNGKALLVRTEPIYGEKNSRGIRPVIGTIIKPYQLLPSPLLEKENNSFMFGTTIDSFIEQDHQVILRLADGDIVFTADDMGRQ